MIYWILMHVYTLYAFSILIWTIDVLGILAECTGKFSIIPLYFGDQIYNSPNFWNSAMKFSATIFFAPLSDIPMFYTNYLTMHEVHMHAGAIWQWMYGCAYVWEIIHSLRLVDYPPVHTHKSYNNLKLKIWSFDIKVSVYTIIRHIYGDIIWI